MIETLAAIALLGSDLSNNPCDVAHLAMNPSGTHYVDPGYTPESRSQEKRLQHAISMIKTAIPACTEEELGIDLSDRSKNHCRRVAQGEVFSEMCYLSGKYGYYFTHINLMDQGIVVFNRWD